MASSTRAGANPKADRLLRWLITRIRKDKERFIRLLAKKLIYPDSGCVEWVGQYNKNGYPRQNACVDGKRVYFYAHHIFWTLKNGRAIAPDREIDHDCDNIRCVLHLEEVTREKNLEKRDRRQAARRIGPDVPF